MSPMATEPSWQLRQSLDGPDHVLRLVGKVVPPIVVVSFQLKSFAERVWFHVSWLVRPRWGVWQKVHIPMAPALTPSGFVTGFKSIGTPNSWEWPGFIKS